GSFENCAALHTSNFREQQSQTAAAEAKHRIRLAHTHDLFKERALLVDLIEHAVHVGEGPRRSHRHLQFRKFAEQLIYTWQEFVQWWIQQSNGNGQPRHLAKDAEE